MAKPKIGATNWTEEGIEPAKAHLAEADALLDALNDRTDDSEALKIINELGKQLREVRGAIFELELFGIDAKKDRLNG